MLQPKFRGHIDDGLEATAGHCGKEVGAHELKTGEGRSHKVLTEDGRKKKNNLSYIWYKLRY